MRENPVHFTFLFLTGQIPDQMTLHGLRWLTVAFYWAVLIASIALAVINWRRDAEQRTPRHVLVFGLRMVLAGMWALGYLWKIPLPVTDGFKYWLGQTVSGAALVQHAALNQFFLNHIATVQPLVVLAEIAFMVSLMLGLFVPVGAGAAALFVANLWLGLYNTQGEWPWTYIGIIVAHAMLALDHAGRSLGADNLLRRSFTPPSSAPSSSAVPGWLRALT